MIKSVMCSNSSILLNSWRQSASHRIGCLPCAHTKGETSLFISSGTGLETEMSSCLLPSSFPLLQWQLWTAAQVQNYYGAALSWLCSLLSLVYHFFPISGLHQNGLPGPVLLQSWYRADRDDSVSSKESPCALPFCLVYICFTALCTSLAWIICRAHVFHSDADVDYIFPWIQVILMEVSSWVGYCDGVLHLCVCDQQSWRQNFDSYSHCTVQNSFWHFF